MELVALIYTGIVPKEIQKRKANKYNVKNMFARQCAPLENQKSAGLRLSADKNGHLVTIACQAAAVVLLLARGSEGRGRSGIWLRRLVRASELRHETSREHHIDRRGIGFLDRLQPAPMVLGPAVEKAKEGVLQLAGDRPAPALAHQDVVDFSDRGDFHGGSGQENFIRGVQLLP